MAKTKIWIFLGMIIWILTVPLLSGVTESPAKAFGIILAWLIFPLIYAFVNKDFEGIGITKNNLRNALKGMFAVTFAYSFLRNALIIYVPSSIQYIAASALDVARILKQGHFGPIEGSFQELFPIMLVITFLAATSNELFFRGFVFTRLKQLVDWRVALLASATLFATYHFLNVGLTGFLMGFIVSVVSGFLMQKYNNVAAPALFHFLQYLATILVFYYFVL